MSLELPVKHAMFEARYPEDGYYEQERERHRQAAWKVRHDGSLDGYNAAREFPCPGTLRAVVTSDPMWEVRCDACRYETTIRNPNRRLREDADDREPVGSYGRSDW